MPRQPRPINNAIVAAYVAGATVPEVAQQCGVPATQVYTQLQRAQVSLRSQARSLTPPPSPAAIDVIGAAYLAGASLTAIARQHGLSRPAVSRLLRLAGIATRAPGPRPRPSNDAIIAAYADGETVSALSRQRGVTAAAISKLLRRAGIAPPTTIVTPNSYAMNANIYTSPGWLVPRDTHHSRDLCATPFAERLAQGGRRCAPGRTSSSAESTTVMAP